MALSDMKVISQPCRVLFAGWETTTSRLQRAGWSLSALQDMGRHFVQISMTLDPPGVCLLSECEGFDYYRGRDHLPTFHVRQAFMLDDRLRVASPMMIDHSPIDAEPQMIREVSIRDLGIFATPLVRTEEIIVEPATVAGLLEQIKSLQAPELAAIRERNRRRDREQPIARQQFHAQILSIAA